MHELLSEISAAIRSIFLSGNQVNLLIAFGAVAIAAFAMRRSSQIGAMTLFALALFAVGIFATGLVGGAPKGTTASQWAQRFTAELNAGVAQIMDMRAGALIAIFVAFMVVLFIVFLIRSRVSVNLSPGGGGHGGGHH
ncbi:MAG: hypothetical protein K2Q06_16640 [Parvularculaceae bacterium]|nr:hypothetical protein [Parvularculaceae bacterium]